ncbi:Uncharacterized protein TCM_042104 [Theobroma cacao]|uniref:Uncharacterized protein n=1 Tax=Theobroma cacao TaxID=3641 RepID=A0A061GY93_THECC|nr:Uncharacterized protein TCM_042104 [Theobroma cacao]
MKSFFEERLVAMPDSVLDSPIAGVPSGREDLCANVQDLLPPPYDVREQEAVFSGEAEQNEGKMKQNTSEGSKNETKTTKAQGHYLEKNLTETRTDDKGKDENFFVLQARVDDSLLPENERRYVTLKGFMGRPLTLFLQGRAGRLGSGKARFQESPKGENG